MTALHKFCSCADFFWLISVNILANIFGLKNELGTWKNVKMNTEEISVLNKLILSILLFFLLIYILFYCSLQEVPWVISALVEVKEYMILRRKEELFTWICQYEVNFKIKHLLVLIIAEESVLTLNKIANGCWYIIFSFYCQSEPCWWLS